MKTSSNYNREFWNAMRGQKTDSIVMNAGKEASDTYVTPSEFREKLDAALAKRNVFRRLGTVVHLSSSEGKLQAVASSGTASWVPNGSAIPESADTFTTFPIQSYKLASQTRLKESFVMDMRFDLEAYLCNDFACRFGREEENACIKAVILASATLIPFGCAMIPPSLQPSEQCYDVIMHRRY